jgi:hypothetical protein
VEDRASRHRGAHGKENPRKLYATGFGRQTRDVSPRQLPTDHDYAVPTRECQGDQPSQKLLDRPLALSSQDNDDRKPEKQGVLSFLRQCFRTVLAVKGRFAAQTPHALDRSGPF